MNETSYHPGYCIPLFTIQQGDCIAVFIQHDCSELIRSAEWNEISSCTRSPRHPWSRDEGGRGLVAVLCVISLLIEPNLSRLTPVPGVKANTVRSCLMLKEDDSRYNFWFT